MQIQYLLNVSKKFENSEIFNFCIWITRVSMFRPQDVCGLLENILKICMYVPMYIFWEGLWFYITFFKGTLRTFDGNVVENCSHCPALIEWCSLLRDTFHCWLIQSERCPQNDMLLEATEVMCWTIRVLWVSLKKLPTDYVITFLSYRAEPLYDPKAQFL